MHRTHLYTRVHVTWLLPPPRQPRDAPHAPLHGATRYLVITPIQAAMRCTGRTSTPAYTLPGYYPYSGSHAMHRTHLYTGLSEGNRRAARSYG